MPSGAVSDAVTVGQPLPGTQPCRSLQVRGEVGVAETEPCVFAVSFQHCERREGIVHDAPTGRGVRETREGVHHRIEVRADVDAEKLQIIGGVADDRQRIRRQDPVEAVGEFGPADAPGKRDDVHAAPPAVAAAAFSGHFRFGMTCFAIP